MTGVSHTPTNVCHYLSFQLNVVIVKYLILFTSFQKMFVIQGTTLSHSETKIIFSQFDSFSTLVDIIQLILHPVCLKYPFFLFTWV